MLKTALRSIIPACIAMVLTLTAAGIASAQNSKDDWTGFYVGGYVGVDHSRSNGTTSTVYSGSGYFADTSVTSINNDGDSKLRSNGFTGGGQFGYNRQFGRLVVGGEVDFGANQASDSSSVTNEYPCCSPTAYTIGQEIKSNWRFTARPRVGVTAGKALIYGTGGLAITDLKYSALFTDTYASAVENGSIEKTKAGYTLGGGVEVKVAKHLSVKGEYLFSNFGRETVNGSVLTTQFSGNDLVGGVGSETWPENVFTHTAKIQDHGFRFGINYRF